MGKKSLPDPGKKSRPYWEFVEIPTTRIEDIKDALKGEEYDTATRGHLHTSPARALGEGVYRSLKHNTGRRAHTYMIHPKVRKTNEPQESLNVEREASFIIQIQNPDQYAGSSQFRGLNSKRKAVFPAHLQGQFRHLRYSLADPPDFLYYEGCEFFIVAASDDIEEELGLELETEGEPSDASCSDLLRTFGETASANPFLKGTWVI